MTGGTGTTESRGATPWVSLALILAGTVVLYLRALHTGFFADDYLFLDQVRGRSLIESLRAPDPLSNFFRPVSRQLYFWIVAGLTHESPFAFRVGNLITLLAVIALLFALARRLAGDRAAVFAAAFLALHYAADIPVRWACGSQELLAVTFALAAILLHVSGRRVGAGVAMLAAALSKEVVLLAPVIAIVADHRPKERWIDTARRAWPLGLAVLVWGLIFLAMPHRRQAQGTEVEFDLVKSPLAALFHLAQVIPGWEWLPGRFDAIPRTGPPLVPAVAAILALALAWRGSSAPPASGRASGAPRRDGARRASAGRGAPTPAQESPASTRSGTRHAIVTGLVWIVVATAPVVAVALLWSAYYYLFAVCAAALVIGVLVARTPVAVAIAALVIAAWGSANARSLGEFGLGRDAWTPVSHINASYLERSNRITDTYLASLQRAYPRLPAGSTVYFGGLKSNVAFQRGDGPLLRWAYRDTSLRGYYLNAFSKQTARPGPLFFFLGAGDTLSEMERGPDLFLRVAFGMIVSDQLKGASDALDVARERQPGVMKGPYWQAWVRLGLGDTAATARLLETAVRHPVSREPSTARAAAFARYTAGDTLGAIESIQQALQDHPYDAPAHGLLADLLLITGHRYPDGAIEAFATRVLAPEDPYAWRRWATVQMDRQRPLEALKSFGQYFRLGGAAAAADNEAHDLVASLKASIPRGSIDPESMPD